MLLLYAMGAMHWVWVMHTDDVPRFYDWSKQVALYGVLSDAVRARMLPLHISEAIQGTDRFLAIPETDLSPQIALLARMDFPGYLLWSIVCYSIRPVSRAS